MGIERKMKEGYKKDTRDVLRSLIEDLDDSVSVVWESFNELDEKDFSPRSIKDLSDATNKVREAAADIYSVLRGTAFYYELSEEAE